LPIWPNPTIIGEPMVGRFRTAPADKRSISFTWSGDTVGQGFGINEDWGGMICYATMAPRSQSTQPPS
jgi:alkaline phosphatase D